MFPLLFLVSSFIFPIFLIFSNFIPHFYTSHPLKFPDIFAFPFFQVFILHIFQIFHSLFFLIFSSFKFSHISHMFNFCAIFQFHISYTFPIFINVYTSNLFQFLPVLLHTIAPLPSPILSFHFPSLVPFFIPPHFTIFNFPLHFNFVPST